MINCLHISTCLNLLFLSVTHLAIITGQAVDDLEEVTIVANAVEEESFLETVEFRVSCQKIQTYLIFRAG